MSTTSLGARQGRTLTHWNPEDKAFWEREGEAIAKLNLWISVPALFRKEIRAPTMPMSLRASTNLPSILPPAAGTAASS